MIAAPEVGQTVYWSDQVGKRPIETKITRLETICRPDGTTLVCASLACNRFVPVSHLLRSLEEHLQEAKSQTDVKPVPAPRASKRSEPKAAHDSGSGVASRTEVAASVPAAAGCGPFLIDFNNLLVRAWHAGKPTENHAVRSMFQTIAAAVRQLRPSGLVFCLDGGHAHRAKLLPSYKAHRPPSDPNLVAQRELAIAAIRAAGLQLMQVAGFEADDVIATLAGRESAGVVLSSDKDLLSLGKAYHPWQAGSWKTPMDVLGVEAGQVCDYLALCGDSVDGIPGVSGIGPKTAQALLQEYGDLETILGAARTLRIPKTTGQKLRDGTADALLSQQLVQLVTNLPLPPIEPWTPPDGWQSLLTAMGLGSVAAILDGIRPLMVAPVAGPTVASTEASAFQDPVTESGVATSRSSESERVFDVVITRSITEPIRERLTVSEAWDGPDRGLIYAWERGRCAAISGEECSWKRGTDLQAAWQMGFELRDLEMSARIKLQPSVPAASRPSLF